MQDHAVEHYLHHALPSSVFPITDVEYVDDTPRVDGGDVTVSFVADGTVLSAECILFRGTGLTEVDREPCKYL